MMVDPDDRRSYERVSFEFVCAFQLHSRFRGGVRELNI